jgi:hypothetical protein
MEIETVQPRANDELGNTPTHTSRTEHGERPLPTTALRRRKGGV